MTGIAEQLRQPAQLWLATAARAAVALTKGPVRRGGGADRAGREDRERALDWSAASTRKLQLCVLRRDLGSLDGFEGEVEGSAEMFLSPLVHRSILVHVYAMVGRSADATAILEELARHDLSEWHVDEDWLLSMCLLAEACDRIGDTARASHVYEALRPHGLLNAVGVGEVGLDSVSRPLGVLATILGCRGRGRTLRGGAADEHEHGDAPDRPHPT